MQRRFGFILDPGPAGNFLLSNIVIQPFVPPRLVLLLFIKISHFCPPIRATDEDTDEVKNHHCIPAVAVRYHFVCNGFEYSVRRLPKTLYTVKGYQALEVFVIPYCPFRNVRSGSPSSSTITSSSRKFD